MRRIFIILLALYPYSAFADVTASALAYQCFGDESYFNMRSSGLDASHGIPMDQPGLHVHGRTDRDLPFRIGSCEFPTFTVEVVKAFQNTPRASGGPCAGADFARYEVWIDGALLADVTSGCPAIDLTVQNWGATLCVRLSQTICENRFWGDVASRVPHSWNVYIYPEISTIDVRLRHLEEDK